MRSLANTIPGRRTPPRAILLDRDGTLIVDVPYNGDPALVQPLPGVRSVLEELRSAGIVLGVLTNQSGIARGLLSREQADAVNARVEEVLGPFELWEVCPHGPEDGCSCRKPAPGMVLSACAVLDLRPDEVAFIGDIGSDVDAAEAAGARSVLVPTPVTRAEEIDRAALVAPDLAGAIGLLWSAGQRADQE